MTPREQWIAYATIVIKEITRFMRIWQQTLVPPAISTLMYFVIFGSLIGKRIGQMDGFDYMDFLVPGLILMAVINASYQNVVDPSSVPSGENPSRNCWCHLPPTASSYWPMSREVWLEACSSDSLSPGSPCCLPT